MGRSDLMAALVGGEGKLDELWMETLASTVGIPPEELKRRADETDASWAGPTSLRSKKTRPKKKKACVQTDLLKLYSHWPFLANLSTWPHLVLAPSFG
jgi:hypothetical protein